MPGNTNATKTNLYGKFLRDHLTPDLQKVWDDTPRNTDLSEELALARVRVAKYQKMIHEGILEVEGQVNHATGQAKIWTTEDLLSAAITQVNRLALSQHDMHPETNASGSMNVTLFVEGQVEEDDVPDLDADGSVPTPEAINVSGGTEVGAEEEDDPLAELGDDP